MDKIWICDEYSALTLSLCEQISKGTSSYLKLYLYDKQQLSHDTGESFPETEWPSAEAMGGSQELWGCVRSPLQLQGCTW